MTRQAGDKQASYDLKNKQTIARFGREKCLEVYEMSGQHVPLKSGQKYSSWQEQAVAELGVSQEEAIDLWSAGNSIIQEKQSAKSGDIISRFGVEKCKEIHADISQSIHSAADWEKSIAEKYNIERSEVTEIFLAGMTLQMKDVAPNVAEAVKQYGKNKHKLHNCPKSGCDGKLHVTVSVSEVNDGLYLCDTCNATFKKKK